MTPGTTSTSGLALVLLGGGGAFLPGLLGRGRVDVHYEGGGHPASLTVLVDDVEDLTVQDLELTDSVHHLAQVLSENKGVVINATSLSGS